MKVFYEKRWFIIIGVVFLATISYFGYQKYESSREEQTVRTYFPSYTLIDYKFVLNGKGIVLNWEEEPEDSNMILGSYAKSKVQDIKVGKRYIVSSEIRLTFKYRETFSTDYRNTYKKGEYYNLNIYDIEDSMSMKTVDLFKLVRQFDSNLVPDEGIRRIAFTGDSEYVLIGTWNLSDKKRSDYLLAINLNTTEVELASDIAGLHSATTGKNEITTGTNLDESVGVGPYENNFYFGTSMPAKSISSQWQLNKEYPEAYQLFLKDDNLYLLDDTVNLETQAAALALFCPEGTNIFQNVTIDADYSVDGQEHTVNSYDEFIQYFKADK